MTTLIKRNNFGAPAIMGRSVFDRIFDDFLHDPAPFVRNSTSGYPLTDIYQDEDGNQIIEMALAGFRKGDLIIETKENTVTISSERQSGDEDNNRRIARRGFKKTFVDYGNKLDFEKASASFENGLLMVKIPQRAEKRSTLVDIK